MLDVSDAPDARWGDFTWLYERCDQVAFLDGHVRAFEFLLWGTGTLRLRQPLRHWDTARGLANAERGGGVLKMMRDYQKEINRRVEGKAKLGDGPPLYGFQLNDKELNAVRAELTPGMTGDAATDFERMLTSDWAKAHIPDARRADMLRQVRDAAARGKGE